MGELLSAALGLHETSETLSSGQMALRGLVVFVFLLVLVRLGHKRFVGRSTAFDYVLAIVLGSVTSRAISGTAPFWPTLVASATLVALHRVVAFLAFRSHRFGSLVKGRPLELVRSGVPIEAAMRRTTTTRHDLDEALREHGVDDLAEVASAHLERSGNISVVRYEPGSSPASNPAPRR